MKNYLLLILIALFSLPVTAETNKHLEAALETVIIPQGEKLERFIDGLVKNQLKSDPSLYLIEDAFKQFYREMMTSEHYKYRIARVQMEFFSLEELNELKELMKLPIFIKYQEVMPGIVPKMMEVGRSYAMENQARLIQLIEAERKKREAEVMKSVSEQQ